jgi:hypothetical protein
MLLLLRKAAASIDVGGLLRLDVRARVCRPKAAMLSGRKQP